MINPNGRKCQLRLQHSKATDDEMGVSVSYPEGPNSHAHALLLFSVFCEHALADLKNLGYDLETIKFSINIDWNSPHAKANFPTLHQKIVNSIPKNLSQMSMFDDDPEEGKPITVTKGSIHGR